MTAMRETDHATVIVDGRPKGTIYRKHGRWWWSRNPSRGGASGQEPFAPSRSRAEVLDCIRTICLGESVCAEIESEQ